MDNPRRKVKEAKVMCSVGRVGRLDMLLLSVGRRTLRWRSAGHGRAKERPKSAVKESGKNRVRGLGVSPAGKEKAIRGCHEKERIGLTSPIARLRMMIEHEHVRSMPQQLRTVVIF